MIKIVTTRFRLIECVSNTCSRTRRTGWSSSIHSLRNMPSNLYSKKRKRLLANSSWIKVLKFPSATPFQTSNTTCLKKGTMIWAQFSWLFISNKQTHATPSALHESLARLRLYLSRSGYALYLSTVVSWRLGTTNVGNLAFSGSVFRWNGTVSSHHTKAFCSRAVDCVFTYTRWLNVEIPKLNGV